MPPTQPTTRSKIAPLAFIGAVVAISAGAFAYTAGAFSPARLTPVKLVDALAPPGGPALGHRRNHAKGVCFTGEFQSNGGGAAFSRAQVFKTGQYRALGRFNLGTPDPKAPDATVRVRGLGLQIATPDGQVWRSAMIDPPFFAVANPQAFYALLGAGASKDPDAMKVFAGAHPEIAKFGEWAKTAPWMASYAADQFNGLNAFILVDGQGREQPVRWSFVPAAAAEPIAPDELAKRGPNYLEQEITTRVTAGEQRWKLVLTLAEPGDQTADPSQPWPAGRRAVDAGTLVVQRIEQEADGPCRDINFDPTILPDGLRVSDDPFPAARSAAYARSYDLRTAEAKDYPRVPAGGQK